MDQVYVGLVTFLVSGALIVVGCHVAISIEQRKAEHRDAIFERWTTRARTLIAITDEVRTSMPTPTPTIVPSVLQTQRWPIRRNEFRGFNSPPGRF
jgi:hypothetical protein